MDDIMGEANAKGSVFMSVGYGLTAEEQQFVELVTRHLHGLGVTPLRIRREAQMLRDPIGTIRAAIQRSHGTLVIAFERYRAQRGVEYPKVGDGDRQAPRKLPTVWNQIEAAMTLQIHHPLLILCEQGLHYEGIIDPSIHPLIPFQTSASHTHLPDHLRDALTTWRRSLADGSATA